MFIERGAVFTPIPTIKQLHGRLQSGKWMPSDIGMQAECSQCREYWPADTEFFDRHNISGLASICKACCSERKLIRYHKIKAQQGARHGR